KKFRHALNTEIIPRLLANTKKPLLGKLNKGKSPKAWKALSRSATYTWLNRLGFYKTIEKKGVYVDGHEKKDIIKYRQEDFLLKIASYIRLLTNYEEDDKGVFYAIPPIL
ncbi:hypothetical protein DL98DRAFT_443709, partial [Cadophora sp. DSE1049]